MADKNAKKKLGDYIEISLPAYGKDQTARIWRDDVRNDAQWEHIKQEAASSGTLVSSGKSDAKAFDSGETLDLTDPITGATAKMPRGNLSDARWEALKKRDPSKNQIYWDIQKDTIEASPTSIKRTVISPDGSQEVSYQAAPRRLPEVGDPRVNDLVDRSGGRTGDRLPRVGDPGVNDAVDRSGAGGTMGGKLRSMLGDMAQGALPGGVPDAGGPATPTLPASDGGVALPPGAPASDGGVALPPGAPDAGAAPSAMAGGVPMPGTAAPDAGMGSPPAEPSGPMPDMGLGTPSPLTNPTDLAVRAGQPDASGTAPMSGQMSAPDPSTVVGAPQASMAPPGYKAELKTQQTATTRVPGSGGSSLEGDLNKSYADAAKAKAEMARMEAEQSGKIAKAEIVRQKNLQSIEDARAARAQALVERQDKVQAAQMRAVESLSEQVKIDPGRLWASRTAQQKADAQLAGFLFGFSGSGAQYVQSLQNEVDKDVQAQLQAAQLTMEGKKAQVAGLGNIFTQLRQQGLDTNEAANVARASLLEIHNSKLMEMKARFEGTTAGVRASEAIAALGPARVKAISDYRTAAAQQASLYSAMRMNELQTRTNAATALMKTKEETPMQATLSKEMAAIEDGIATARQMLSDSSVGTWEKWKTSAAGGAFGSGWEKIAKYMDPNSGARAMDFKGKRIAMLKDIFGGALQAHELAAAEGMLPETISPMTDLRPYFDRIVSFGQQQIARRQERYSKSGADTRGPSAGGQGGPRW